MMFFSFLILLVLGITNQTQQVSSPPTRTGIKVYSQRAFEWSGIKLGFTTREEIEKRFGIAPTINSDGRLGYDLKGGSSGPPNGLFSPSRILISYTKAGRGEVVYSLQGWNTSGPTEDEVVKALGGPSTWVNDSNGNHTLGIWFDLRLTVLFKEGKVESFLVTL